MRHMLGVMLLFVVGPANAATVVTGTCDSDNDGQRDDICATEIQGLEFQGTTYNVSFEFDTFNNLGLVLNTPVWGNFSAAEQLRTTVGDALNTSSATGVGPDEFSGDNTFWVAWNWDGVNADVVGQACCNPPFGWNVDIATNQDANTDFVYATFTAVPIPAAVWLFGSGLGLLGWFRRVRL